MVGAHALAAVEQQQRGLDRQCRDAGAADRGNERVDLRLGGLGVGGPGDARAGSHQFDRLDRLDQEIRDPHLQQAARHLGVEALRHHHHRRPRSMRSIIRSSASISTGSPTSTSTMTTVLLPGSKRSPTSRRCRR